MKLFSKHNQLGFTLIELMLVSLIVGLIIGFALPNYEKAMERSEERTIANNLQMIREGLRMYKARYGANPTTKLNDINEINETFGLQIADSNATYTCQFWPPGDGFDCKGDPGSWWYLHIETWAEGEVHCDSASCPTCTRSECFFD